MKNFKKVLALVLVLATLMGFATVAGAEYKDEADISADYSEAIQVLELIETMEGYPDGTFGPKKTITREEAAKLIAIFDNKDSDISTYYTSINPFADEKGRWGESYVGYGYRAGIIAGMNATTYAPTANVTGTQFLKMALVTLGYDQEAEGFVGSSWAVNVLALARKLDLIDGLADGWKAEADLTREEAAQILLNTLKADTVEYAQEAKQVGFKPSINADKELVWAGRIYLTVAGAVSTGNKLYKDFGLEKGTSYDAFYRPYVKWTLGKDSVEVMEAPKATFTTRFSACDLLKELGIKETDRDTTIVIDGVYDNGVPHFTDPLCNGNGTDYTLDEHFEIRPAGQTHNGYTQDKFIGISHTNQFGIWHHDLSDCAEPTAAKHGAQGTLTQVFYNGKDSEGNKHYYVVSIETWLAKVKSVVSKTVSRDEHTKSVGSVKLETVYTHDLVSSANANENYGAYSENFAANRGETGADRKLRDVKSYLNADEERVWNNLTYDDPTGIAKGDYVLLTYSFKTGDEGVQSLDVVEGKDGRYNGHKFVKVAENPSQTRVDGEYVADAVHFSLGYDLSKSGKFGTYTFFYDAYGNVIGMKESADTSKYAVIDAAWMTFTGKGVADLKADVVGLDANIAEDVSIKDFTPYTTLQSNLPYTDQWAIDPDNFAYSLAKALKLYTNGEGQNDFKPLYDHLYKSSVDSNGKYTLKFDDDVLNSGAATEIKVSNKTPYMALINGDKETKVALTSDTQFLVHNMDGTYSAYTGFKNVPSLLAHYAEYVMDDDNDFAEVVYLCRDVYTTDSKFIAFVGEPANKRLEEAVVDGDSYYGLTIYVGAEEKTVYLTDTVMRQYFSAAAGSANAFTAGFYQFQYVTIEGVEIVDVVKGPKNVNELTALSGKQKYLAEAVDIHDFNDAGTVIQVLADGATKPDIYSLADDCKIYAIYKDAVNDDIDADYIFGTFTDTEVEGPDGYLSGLADAYDVYLELNDDDQVINLYYVLPDNAAKK